MSSVKRVVATLLVISALLLPTAAFADAKPTGIGAYVTKPTFGSVSGLLTDLGTIIGSLYGIKVAPGPVKAAGGLGLVGSCVDLYRNYVAPTLTMAAQGKDYAISQRTYYQFR